ncbi:unnamed protein product [Coregonus sp. 'balchen']|nr:unnamed protein product [Coregonus sp. 'balchen']
MDVYGQMPAPHHQHLPPQAHQYQPQSQPQPQGVPFTAAPPSMLPALDEMGVRGVARRVITLPPIVQRVPSFSSRRGTRRGGGGTRGFPRISSQSSGSSNRTSVDGGGGGDSGHYRDTLCENRHPSPPRRGILHSYSDESDWDNRRGGPRREGRGSAGSRTGWSGSAQRSCSRDDLMKELHRSAPARQDGSYSPPPLLQGSLSSDEEDSRRGGGRDGTGGGKGKLIRALVVVPVW